MKLLLEKLNEPSTWKGIITILVAFGIQIDPEVQSHILTLGLAIVGLINIKMK